MVITDPPYNVRVAGNVGRGRIKHPEFARASGEMSEDVFSAFLKDMLENMADVMRDGALAFVFIDWRHIGDLVAAGGHAFDEMDNRLFVEAVVYRYRAGVAWRDLPERFGDGVKVQRRFSRWAQSDVWERVFQHLCTDADNEYAMIDSPARRCRSCASPRRSASPRSSRSTSGTAS